MTCNQAETLLNELAAINANLAALTRATEARTIVAILLANDFELLGIDEIGVASKLSKMLCDRLGLGAKVEP